MRQRQCERCQCTQPMNEMVSVRGQEFCRLCAEALIGERDKSTFQEGDILLLTDPTICGRCGSDGGEAVYEALAGSPMCAPCTQYLRAHPYPAWLKIAAAALACFVIFSLWNNLRFLEAHMLLTQFDEDVAEPDLDTLTGRYEQLAQKMPEIDLFDHMAHYFRSAKAMAAGDYGTAESELRPLIGKLPPEYEIQRALDQIELAKAFDEKDYDHFVELSVADQARHPGEPMAEAQLASAYACQFAVSGDAAAQQQSFDHISAARKLAESAPQEAKDSLEHYIARISHRLDTREIIDENEYAKRFGSDQAGDK